jgi:cytochrome c oxidase cbb3-type subunit I/II
MDPRSTSAGSIMPAYAWLSENTIDKDAISVKIKAMRHLGVPYTKEDVENAETLYSTQATSVVENLAKDGVTVGADSEMVAIIAYMQRLGKDIKQASPEELKEN